jgi:hypothetical protein
MNDAESANTLMTSVYKDWIDWLRNSASSWVKTLVEQEQAFREIGLNYYHTPYQMHHSATLLHGASVEQLTLNRLSKIFETDLPRAQQQLFEYWLEINNTAVKVLNDSRYHVAASDDIHLLCNLSAQLELALSPLSKTFQNLQSVLHWIELAVDAVSRCSDLDGSESWRTSTAAKEHFSGVGFGPFLNWSTG